MVRSNALGADGAGASFSVFLLCSLSVIFETVPSCEIEGRLQTYARFPIGGTTFCLMRLHLNQMPAFCALTAATKAASQRQKAALRQKILKNAREKQILPSVNDLRSCIISIRTIRVGQQASADCPKISIPAKNAQLSPRRRPDFSAALPSA